MSAHALLSRCRGLGADLIPQPDGKLKVRSSAPLPDDIRAALKQLKAEVVALLRQAASSWPCPRCGQPATIADVFPSEDGERTLTMWRCDPCQVVAVTPNTIKEPPAVWVKNTEQ